MQATLVTPKAYAQPVTGAAVPDGRQVTDYTNIRLETVQLLPDNRVRFDADLQGKRTTAALDIKAIEDYVSSAQVALSVNPSPDTIVQQFVTLLQHQASGRVASVERAAVPSQPPASTSHDAAALAAAGEGVARADGAAA